MGLLDELDLGDALKGVLGKIEAAGLPATINAVLATRNITISTASSPRCRKAALTLRCSPGSAQTTICQLPRTSSKPCSATRRCRTLPGTSACPSMRR